ncbi:MAG: hypothetical protein JW932_15475 [Deltaproteobacteria bacterium]|nr:hypothetical protein [Deltaproteobacteria bacterium]
MANPRDLNPEEAAQGIHIVSMRRPYIRTKPGIEPVLVFPVTFSPFLRAVYFGGDGDV